MLATSHAAYAWVPCPTAEIPSASVEHWITQYGERRETAKGVTLCEGDGGFFENTRGFLQIVDLGDGAKVRLQAQANTTTPREWLSPQTLYKKRTAEDWYYWIRGLSSEGRNQAWLNPEKTLLFSVTNASFFKETEGSESRLSWPFMFAFANESLGMAFLEAWPNYPRPGWRLGGPRANADYDAPKSVLQLSSEMRPEHAQSVRIRGFRERYEYEDVDAWFRSHPEDPFSIKDAAVSVPGEYDRSGVRESKRRTYVGVWGQIVYIWATDDEFTTEEANATMQEIQPGMDVIQMDGGGSTQFFAGEYGSLNSLGSPITSRAVPTVLSVYRGP
jgi:hypothetical protein